MKRETFYNGPSKRSRPANTMTDADLALDPLLTDMLAVRAGGVMGLGELAVQDARGILAALKSDSVGPSGGNIVELSLFLVRHRLANNEDIAERLARAIWMLHVEAWGTGTQDGLTATASKNAAARNEEARADVLSRWQKAKDEALAAGAAPPHKINFAAGIIAEWEAEESAELLRRWNEAVKKMKPQQAERDRQPFEEREKKAIRKYFGSRPTTPENLARHWLK